MSNSVLCGKSFSMGQAETITLTFSGEKYLQEKNGNQIIHHANVKTEEVTLKIISIFSTLKKDRQSWKSDAIVMSLLNLPSFPKLIFFALF